MADRDTYPYGAVRADARKRRAERIRAAAEAEKATVLATAEAHVYRQCEAMRQMRDRLSEGYTPGEFEAALEDPATRRPRSLRERLLAEQATKQGESL